jgi:uncharacterized protein (TIGR03118 family)
MINAATRSCVRRFASMITTFELLVSGAAFAQHYQQTDLVTDSTSVSSTATIDPNLVNAWGMSRGSGSPWWISDNGTGLVTLYDSTGAIVPLVVTIPAPNGQGTSAPTGQVFNYTTSFQVSSGHPAVFIFATEDGTISGWNPGVNVLNAILMVNNSDRAVYKGIALAQSKSGPRLYATNFQTGEVDVFDANFKQMRARRDDDDDGNRFRIPRLNKNWAPFGIQNVGGNLVVTFAHRAPGQHDEDHGPGLGWVGVFDTEGRLLQVLEHGNFDNAPWGIAMAPGDFGAFTHRLLIGNFGDGTIHAYNVITGRHEGTMLDSNGSPISIDGLWGLSFGGDNVRNGLATELFFTAGPNDESDGLFGKITPTASELRGNSE